MENAYLLPSALCDQIFAHEFDLDLGPLSQLTLTRTVQLYVVPLLPRSKPSHTTPRFIPHSHITRTMTPLLLP